MDAAIPTMVKIQTVSITLQRFLCPFVAHCHFQATTDLLSVCLTFKVVLCSYSCRVSQLTLGLAQKTLNITSKGLFGLKYIIL